MVYKYIFQVFGKYFHCILLHVKYVSFSQFFRQYVRFFWKLKYLGRFSYLSFLSLFITVGMNSARVVANGEDNDLIKSLGKTSWPWKRHRLIPGEDLMDSKIQFNSKGDRRRAHDPSPSPKLQTSCLFVLFCEFEFHWRSVYSYFISMTFATMDEWI